MAVGKDQHILESISYPDDLRQLPQEQLEEVCAEIRRVSSRCCSLSDTFPERNIENRF